MPRPSLPSESSRSRSDTPSWLQDAGLRLVQVDDETWQVELGERSDPNQATYRGDRIGDLLSALARRPAELLDLEHGPGPAQRLFSAVLSALRAYEGARRSVFRGAILRPDAPAAVVEGLPVILAEAEVAAGAWLQALAEAGQPPPGVAARLLATVLDERLDLQLAMARWRLALAAWGEAQSWTKPQRWPSGS